MKRLANIMALCCLWLASFGQGDLAHYFLTMPDTLVPYWNTTQRLYMATLAKQGDSISTVENLFGDVSRVLSFTESCLSVEVTDGVRYELAWKGDSLLLVQTVCLPVCVSAVRLFTPQWQYVATLHPPFDAELVSASVSSGELVWTDMTPMLLDEEERKHYQTEE